MYQALSQTVHQSLKRCTQDPHFLSRFYETFLNASPETSLPDGLASERLAYLRGIRTDESPLGPFRSRPKTVLGDIVNSDPAYVGPPSARRRDADFAAFFTAHSSRPPRRRIGLDFMSMVTCRRP